MWSSTASTASTIRYDEDWAFPVESEILDTCHKDRDFYEPTVQLDENFVFNTFKRTPKNNIFPKRDIKKDKFTDTNKTQDELIKQWAEKNLYNDKRTLEEIYNDDKEEKKKYQIILKDFYTREWPYYVQSISDFKTKPYVDRLYCYPKIMCLLGWQIVSAQKIFEYVQLGISLFLIDIRFGTRQAQKKLGKHIHLARKRLTEGAYSTFGFAFLIHGRKLKCGLMYKQQDIFLDRDSTIILTADHSFSARGTNNIIYVNFYDYIKILQVGDEIKIGSEIKVIVNGITKSSVVCIVKKDGLVRDRTTVILPINRRTGPKLDITKEEADDIALAINSGCDYLICPCVTEKLIEHINWVLAVRSRVVIVLHFIVFDKYLTKERIHHIFSIADGIYIYSDGKNEDPIICDYIFKEAFLKNKLIIRGGFIHNEICSKNIDKETLKHLLLYPDCIVVSRCEADKNIIEIKSLIRDIYPEMNREIFKISFGPICHNNNSIENVFCKYILSYAFISKVTLIIVINNNGEFVRLLAKYRPLVPILGIFLDLPTARRCLISRNVYAIMYPGQQKCNWTDELSLRLAFAKKYIRFINCTHKDQKFLFCYESKPGLKFCDSVRILTI